MKYWHNWLDMPHKDLAWHKEDMRREYEEYLKARGLLAKWSELSDIVYTTSRARWTGHEVPFPIGRGKRLIGVIYMYPKYSGRFLFFRSAGKKAGATRPLKEIRNPKKVQKLHHIAHKYDLDPQAFEAICKKQLRRWPLLP